MADLATLHAKLAALKQKTAAMKVAAEGARARADKAKSEYESYTSAHQAHSMIVAALEHKIASTNADTAKIDRGLRAEDHARDSGGAAGVGPRGGHYVVISGKKHYLKK